MVKVGSSNHCETKMARHNIVIGVYSHLYEKYLALSRNKDTCTPQTIMKRDNYHRRLQQL